MSGCKWIQISDLFRWYREGRFSVTMTQINALNFCTSWKGTYRLKERVYLPQNYGVQPTSESLRILSFLNQVTGIPTSITSLSFSEVLFRMLYNVNLPRLFLRQLNHLIQCLPSVNVETGFDLFSNILPVNPNFLDIICTENRIIGSKSYFEEAFIEETDFMNSSSGKKLLISSEAKAAALILFALKLYFGLDDKREFSMDCIEKPSNNNLTPFDFRCWFIQLKLRMFVWQGRPIQSVLSKSFCAEQPPYERQEASRQRLSKFNIPLYPRDCKFSGCVPNIVKNDDFKYHFNNAFIDSTKTSESCSTKSNMALYAPLQHIRKTFVVDDDDGIDQHNFEAFYADFYDNCHLELKCNDDEANNVGRIILNNSPSFSKEFSELFPCARRYLRTPQENQRCCVIRRSSLLKNTMFDYAEPVLLEHFIWLLFSAATKRFLSSTFQSLLRHFALIISETEYLLYFTFLLVEALILEQTKMVKLEENLRAGHEETFHSGRSQYRLKLSDETKDGPCHRFKYIIFKKLTPKIVYDEDLMSNSDDERTEEPQQNAKFYGEGRTMSESSASLSSASSQSSSKQAPSSVSSDSSGISDSEDENRIGSGADTAPKSPQAGASDVRPKAQIKERPGRGVSLPSILAMRLISFRFW